MAWDNLVNITNQAKAKVCIYNNTDLDQTCSRAKQLLKIKDSNQNK